MEDYPPIQGKTYSLFAGGDTTDLFYRKLGGLTDELIDNLDDGAMALLALIKEESQHKKKLRRTARKAPGHSDLARILHRCREELDDFLGDVEGHIRHVPLHQRVTEKTILCTREQHYLYMLMFELVNRLNLEKFRKANYRIAMLPYCLKETHMDCRAERDEIDFRCKSCRKSCYISRVAGLLKKHDIVPYILSQGRVSNNLKILHRKHGGIGVLGIACVIELIWGIRICMDAGLPVIGMPLNANRCPRWMGTMHDTSIDLEALDHLLA